MKLHLHTAGKKVGSHKPSFFCGSLNASSVKAMESRVYVTEVSGVGEGGQNRNNNSSEISNTRHFIHIT